jgi:hypothetical protein
LLNPYGPQLWIATLSGLSRGFSDITEWRPIWSVAVGYDSLFLWLLAAAGTVAALRRVAWDPWTWGWTLLTLAAAAQSRRLVAFAALTPALLLVPAWQSAERVAPIVWTAPRRWACATLVAACSVWAVLAVAPSLTCFPPLAAWNAPEADAVAFLRSTPARRVIVHFDYGEYAIFHLRDRMQVSTDNRHYTVYSDAAIKASDRFVSGLDPDYPERIGADAIWLPTSKGRVLALMELRGWARRFEGPRTVVLLRTAGELVRGRPTIGTPCFPNP